MRHLHAGRFSRLIAAAGSAVFLGLLLPAASAAASITDPAYPDAPAGAYDIYKELPCQCWDGQTAIAYRVGYYIPPSTGFGHTKVLDKHNMYTPIVAFIVKGPNNSHTSGTSGEAYAYAAHIVDGQIEQVLKILAKYDTRKLSDNHSFGIVTAWCDGIQGKCPQWVNEAINASATPQTTWSANGTELSYEAPSLSSG
jgi:hypothetical protein